MMVRIKKLLFVFIISGLFLAAAGCGNNPAQSSKQETESSRSQAQSSEPEQESSSPSSLNVVSTVQSIESSSSSSATGVSSSTQQEILNKVKKSLNTNISVLLPESVSLESGKYLTATTSSGKSKYSVKLFQTSKPSDVNSKSASKGTLITEITGTEMKNAETAKESIADDGYMQVKASDCPDCIIDLGNNIKAVWDCGCGHQSIVWNEGRWCIRIDGPADKTMASKKYPDSKALAISVAAYLDKNMLPAPQKIGLIQMSTWKNDSSDVASVEWQNGSILYQVGSSDPMTALETAVAMKAA